LKIRTLTLARTVLDPGRFPQTPWKEVAVSGRSNVGKSSLLNTILGRKNIARVSKEPGKTRTVNFFLVNDRFYLVDLPGYGYAKVSAEMRKRFRGLIIDYFEQRESLGGVVQLVDARHPLMKDDLLMLGHLAEAGRSFLIVLTKADKIGRGQRQRVLKELRSSLGGAQLELLGGSASGEGEASSDPDRLPVLFFSARTGEGKEHLWEWISEHVG
jgi:GTP-binding protein